MSACLLGIGTATPPGRITRGESVEVALRMAWPGSDRAAVKHLATRAGVDSRGSVLIREPGDRSYYPPPAHAGARGPTTSERLARGEQAAVELACEAGAGALARAGVPAPSITHVVSASCTILGAPGFDHGVIERLGLPLDVRRTNIGFMGCHAAINALAVAGAIVRADRDARVLVCCVELCTLHMHYTDRADQLIANALFADGAAAAVIGWRENSTDVPILASFGSRLFRDTNGDATRASMGWRIGDHGFEMTLGRDVPEHLHAGVPPWVDSLLACRGLARGDVGAWAIHPGGPRIVRTLVEALGLPPAARDQAESDAMAVLHAHGNMSSATILFILDRLRSRGACLPWVGMAFGPGLAGEAVLIT